MASERSDNRFTMSESEEIEEDKEEEQEGGAGPSPTHENSDNCDGVSDDSERDDGGTRLDAITMLVILGGGCVLLKLNSH